MRKMLLTTPYPGGIPPRAPLSLGRVVCGVKCAVACKYASCEGASNANTNPYPGCGHAARRLGRAMPQGEALMRPGKGVGRRSKKGNEKIIVRIW